MYFVLKPNIKLICHGYPLIDQASKVGLMDFAVCGYGETGIAKGKQNTFEKSWDSLVKFLKGEDFAKAVCYMENTINTFVNVGPHQCFCG